MVWHDLLHYISSLLSRSDLNIVHEQVLTNRSRTNNLSITHSCSRTFHGQAFTGTPCSPSKHRNKNTPPETKTRRKFSLSDTKSGAGEAVSAARSQSAGHASTVRAFQWHIEYSHVNTHILSVFLSEGQVKRAGNATFFLSWSRLQMTRISSSSSEVGWKRQEVPVLSRLGGYSHEQLYKL